MGNIKLNELAEIWELAKQQEQEQQLVVFCLNGSFLVWTNLNGIGQLELCYLEMDIFTD